MWPSFDSACQRTVYGPFGSFGSDATISRCAGIARGVPATFLPSGVNTWIAFGSATTLWSNWRSTCRGDRASSCLNEGDSFSQRRVRERRARKREGGECGDDERAPHRCIGPANCERCPKIGATSRSQ